jgi:hypothetical protein
MIKKLILLGVILLPFVLYYLSVFIIKKDTNKKFPIIPLSLASLLLLACVLIFFRLSDTNPSDGKYVPPQFKDGKIISPKTR